MDRLSTDGDARNDGDAGMTMAYRWSFLILLLLPAISHADGGTVRLSEVRGPYKITVFLSPTPFRAGPVDVSALVQDAKTNKPIDGLRLTLSYLPRDRSSIPKTVQVTRAAATNKLFYSAKFELPSSGWWQMRLRVRGASEAVTTIDFDALASERLPRWLEMWPWLTLPSVPTLFFLLHQFRAGRRTRTQ